MAQRWEVEDFSSSTEVHSLTWLDGGNKIAYHNFDGLEMYDFEKNLKYRWGPEAPGSYFGWDQKVFLVKNKNWIGTIDADHKVRFWPYPA